MVKKESQQLTTYIKENQRPYSCTLSVSLLVSNRIDTIKNCLDSLQPLLNQVSSELIIVDTVGQEQSDGSLAIAEKYADQVVHYKWNNDFAAARNVGLDVAKGEWFLFIDDDEWFEDVTELVKFFNNKNEMQQYCSLAFHKHNYLSVGNTNYSDIMVTQCTRLFYDTKFHHPVHENLQPVVLPIKHVSCFVHHYGYANGRLGKKLERNESIMLADLKREPQNMHLWAQLISSAEISNIDERQKMLLRIEQASNEFVKMPSKDSNAFVNFFVIFCRKLAALAYEKNWSSVIRQGQNFEKVYGQRLTGFQFCALDYYLCQALVNNIRINDSLKIAWDILQDYLKNLERVENDPNKDLANYTPFLQNKVGYVPFYELLLSLLEIIRQDKDWLKIKSMIREVPLYHAGDKAGIIINLFVEAILQFDHSQSEMQFLYNEIFDNQEGSKAEQIAAFAAVIRKHKQDPEKRQKLQLLLTKLKGNSTFLEIQKAIAFESNEKEFLSRINNLKKNFVINDQLDCEELVPLLIKHQLDPSFVVTKLSYDRWNQAVQTIGATYLLKHDTVLPFITKIKEIWPACPEREILVIVLRRAYLFNNFTTIDEIKDQLPFYIEDALQLGQQIYSSELFENAAGEKLLPSEFKFVLQMKQALEYEKQKNYVAYLKKLRQALKTSPNSSYMISKLKWQVAIQTTKQDKANQEFLMLGKQVKNQIMQLLLSGQSQAALPLVKQLAQLMPNDPETKGLLREVLKKQ